MTAEGIEHRRRGVLFQRHETSCKIGEVAFAGEESKVMLPAGAEM